MQYTRRARCGITGGTGNRHQLFGGQFSCFHFQDGTAHGWCFGDCNDGLALSEVFPVWWCSKTRLGCGRFQPVQPCECGSNQSGVWVRRDAYRRIRSTKRRTWCPTDPVLTRLRILGTVSNASLGDEMQSTLTIRRRAISDLLRDRWGGTRLLWPCWRKFIDHPAAAKKNSGH
jgi:hypothetical protein